MPEVRLIDGNELAKSAMAKMIDSYLYNQCNLTVGLAAALMPEIEAEPIRHAYWEPSEIGEYHCTNCGIECDVDKFHKALLNPYCGKCGAKMYWRY